MEVAGTRTLDDFAEFMRHSSARLYRAAYLLTGDPAQAEELTQSALVRVYSAWGRIRGEDHYG
jgi:DNA-directed RNA polymerase specialized sigma24 family protein